SPRSPPRLEATLAISLSGSHKRRLRGSRTRAGDVSMVCLCSTEEMPGEVRFLSCAVLCLSACSGAPQSGGSADSGGGQQSGGASGQSAGGSVGGADSAGGSSSGSGASG